MCELIIGAWYKRGSNRENKHYPHQIFFSLFTLHSLRQRQLSVTPRDKTLISRNQISGENRTRGGTEKSTKGSRDLIVIVDERHIAAENVSFFHLSCFICVFLFFFSFSIQWLCSRQVLRWGGGGGGSASFLGNTPTLVAWHNEHDLAFAHSCTHTHTVSSCSSVCLAVMSVTDWSHLVPKLHSPWAQFYSQCIDVLYCICVSVTSPPRPLLFITIRIFQSCSEMMPICVFSSGWRLEDAAVWNEKNTAL